MGFKIMTDSAANLPQNIVTKYDLMVIPLSYYIEGVEHTCADLSEFDGHAYYELLRNKVQATTSLANSARFEEAMEACAATGQNVLYLGVSSGISGTCASAAAAAAEVEARHPERRIVVVDTLAASLGEGMQVIRAAQLREEGKSLEETAAQLREELVNMSQVFTVDDLMFLKRGGRVSGMSAVIGTVLQVKPILKGDPEGKIVVAGKCRGRKAALKALADVYNRTAVLPEKQTIGIAHGDCQADVEVLKTLLREKRAPGDILEVCYEPVTGCHVGPGTVALFFYGTEAKAGKIK